MNYLRQLVEFLFSQKEKYQLSTVGMFTIDDESAEDQDKAVFAQKFTQMLLALCSNYEVLFLTPDNWPYAQKLYELLFIAANAKNLGLVALTCEFWTQLKETLLEGCRNYEHENASTS